MSALLEDVARDAARLPDTHIQARIAAGIEVAGNPVDLKRVFNNLIENARRYGKTPASGIAEIEIVCRVEDDKAVVEVSDRGIGVPEGDIEHLLRPFTRLDTARGQANGAGLGLAIVDRVVSRHGGKLRLINRDGGGLSAQIILAAKGAAN